MRLIDADVLIKDLTESVQYVKEWVKESHEKKDEQGLKCAIETRRALQAMISRLKEAPTIEPEVRRGKGCKFCKGRSYTKKPLTVITRTMKHVEVVFEYCPACGRKMDGGADNG